jgi:hypothetical protein
MKAFLTILLGALVVAFLYTLVLKQKAIREKFGTSPGTLVQLATSHVPTEEDVIDMIRERERVQRDLIDLTGSP